MSRVKTYAWRVYSNYGYVRATNIKNAMYKMIDSYFSDTKKNETLAWGDFIIKEIKYER